MIFDNTTDSEELDKGSGQTGIGASPTVRQAAASKPPAAAPAQQPDVDALIAESAKEFRVPKTLLGGLLTGESSRDPNTKEGPVTRSGERAVSWAQGMPDTVKEMGFDVEVIRKDPKEAARFAAKYLRHNYDSIRGAATDDKQAWLLSGTAYFSGPDRVKESLARGGDGIPEGDDQYTTIRDYTKELVDHIKGYSQYLANRGANTQQGGANAQATVAGTQQPSADGAQTVAGEVQPTVGQTPPSATPDGTEPEGVSVTAKSLLPVDAYTAAANVTPLDLGVAQRQILRGEVPEFTTDSQPAFQKFLDVHNLTDSKTSRVEFVRYLESLAKATRKAGETDEQFDARARAEHFFNTLQAFKKPEEKQAFLAAVEADPNFTYLLTALTSPDAKLSDEQVKMLPDSVRLKRNLSAASQPVADLELAQNKKTQESPFMAAQRKGMTGEKLREATDSEQAKTVNVRYRRETGDSRPVIYAAQEAYVQSLGLQWQLLAKQFEQDFKAKYGESAEGHFGVKPEQYISDTEMIKYWNSKTGVWQHPFQVTDQFTRLANAYKNGGIEGWAAEYKNQVGKEKQADTKGDLYESSFTFQYDEKKLREAYDKALGDGNDRSAAEAAWKAEAKRQLDEASKGHQAGLYDRTVGSLANAGQVGMETAAKIAANASSAVGYAQSVNPFAYAMKQVGIDTGGAFKDFGDKLYKGVEEMQANTPEDVRREYTGIADQMIAGGSQVAARLGFSFNSGIGFLISGVLERARESADSQYRGLLADLVGVYAGLKGSQIESAILKNTGVSQRLSGVLGRTIQGVGELTDPLIDPNFGKDGKELQAVTSAFLLGALLHTPAKRTSGWAGVTMRTTTDSGDVKTASLYLEDGVAKWYEVEPDSFVVRNTKTEALQEVHPKLYERAFKSQNESADAILQRERTGKDLNIVKGKDEVQDLAPETAEKVAARTTRRESEEASKAATKERDMILGRVSEENEFTVRNANRKVIEAKTAFDEARAKDEQLNPELQPKPETVESVVDKAQAAAEVVQPTTQPADGQQAVDVPPAAKPEAQQSAVVEEEPVGLSAEKSVRQYEEDGYRKNIALDQDLADKWDGLKRRRDEARDLYKKATDASDKEYKGKRSKQRGIEFSVGRRALIKEQQRRDAAAKAAEAQPQQASQTPPAAPPQQAGVTASQAVTTENGVKQPTAGDKVQIKGSVKKATVIGMTLDGRVEVRFAGSDRSRVVDANLIESASPMIASQSEVSKLVSRVKSPSLPLAVKLTSWMGRYNTDASYAQTVDGTVFINDKAREALKQALSLPDEAVHLTLHRQYVKPAVEWLRRNGHANLASQIAKSARQNRSGRVPIIHLGKVEDVESQAHEGIHALDMKFPKSTYESLIQKDSMMDLWLSLPEKSLYRNVPFSEYVDEVLAYGLTGDAHNFGVEPEKLANAVVDVVGEIIKQFPNASVDELARKALVDFGRVKDEAIKRQAAEAEASDQAVVRQDQGDIRGRQEPAEEAGGENSAADLDSVDNVLDLPEVVEAGNFLEDFDGLSTDSLISAKVRADVENSPEFKKWFGKSKIVNEDGSKKILLHGTLNDFDSFDINRTSVENYHGRGFYFTDSVEDVNFNYSTEEGPDFKASKMAFIEDAVGKYEDEGYDSIKALKKAEEDWQAKRVDNLGQVMEVYVKMENPIEIYAPQGHNGRYRKQTVLDVDRVYSALVNVLGNDQQARKASARFYDLVDGAGDLSGNVGAWDVDNALRLTDGVQNSEDADGLPNGSDIIAKVYRSLGYDGIIFDAGYRFARMGIPEPTRHYVVWKPEQIKSATGNSGEFNPSNPKISAKVIKSQPPPTVDKILRESPTDSKNKDVRAREAAQVRLKKTSELTKYDIARVVKNGRFALLSGNPHDLSQAKGAELRRLQSDAAEKTLALRRELETIGYTVVEASGHYLGTNEPALMVLMPEDNPFRGIKPEVQINRLSRKYAQKQVMYGLNGEYTAPFTDGSGKVSVSKLGEKGLLFDAGALQQQGYTKVRTSDGELIFSSVDLYAEDKPRNLRKREREIEAEAGEVEALIKEVKKDSKLGAKTGDIIRALTKTKSSRIPKTVLEAAHFLGKLTGDKAGALVEPARDKRGRYKDGKAVDKYEAVKVARGVQDLMDVLERYFVKKKDAGTNGSDWYERKIQELHRRTGVVLPSIKTDKQFEVLFDLIMAATSIGEKPDRNYKNAVDVFSRFITEFNLEDIPVVREEEVTRERLDKWNKTEANVVELGTDPTTGLIKVQVNYGRAGSLLEKVGMAMKGYVPFTDGKVEAREAIKRGEDVIETPNFKDVNGASQYFIRDEHLTKMVERDGHIKGMLNYLMSPTEADSSAPFNAQAVMGPKIGAFFLNIAGFAQLPTIDMWMSRWWYRLNGGLIAQGEKSKAGIYKLEVQDIPKSLRDGDLIRAAYQHATEKWNQLHPEMKLTPMAVQAASWYDEKWVWELAGAEPSGQMDYSYSSDIYLTKRDADDPTKRMAATGNQRRTDRYYDLLDKREAHNALVGEYLSGYRNATTESDRLTSARGEGAKEAARRFFIARLSEAAKTGVIASAKLSARQQKLEALDSQEWTRLAEEMKGDFLDPQENADLFAILQRGFTQSQDARIQTYRDLYEYVGKLGNPSMLKFTSAVLKAFRLSGVKTTARNVISNTAFQALEELRRAVSAPVDMTVSLLTKQPRTTQGVSPRAVLYAIKKSKSEGVAQAMEIMRTGDAGTGFENISSESIRSGYKVLDKTVGNFAKFVFRAQSAQDALFRSYALNRALYEQAVLEEKSGGRSVADVLANPTLAQSDLADRIAAAAVFQEQNWMYDQYEELKSKTPEIVQFLLDYRLPFVKTGTNIFDKVLDYTGVKGAVKTLVFASDVAKQRTWADAKKAMREVLSTPEAQRNFALLAGRNAVGLSIYYTGYLLAQAGMMTGFYSDDEGENEARRIFGAYPASMKVGDRWVEVSQLSPVGTMLTAGASHYEESTRELEDESKRLSRYTKLGMDVLNTLPMARAATDLSRDVKSGKILDVTGLIEPEVVVPAIVSEVAQTLDPTKREIRDDDWTKRAVNRMQSKIPVLRSKLPAKISAVGETSPQPYGFDPFNVSRDVKTPLAQELKKTGAGVTPIRQDKKNKETNAQYQRRKVEEGKTLNTILNDLISREEYSSAGKKEKKELIEKSVSATRSALSRVRAVERSGEDRPEVDAESLVDRVIGNHLRKKEEDE